MQRMERDARAGHGRENGRQLEPSGTTGIPATHGRHTPRRSLSAAPEGKNKRQSPTPSTPATMLAMTSCCRTRFAHWEIFARDLACRRNIVAGGGGKIDSRLFFPSGASRWEFFLAEDFEKLRR